MSDGIHRDDLPMEVAEEITRTLQDAFPGYKVTFAGDAPGGPSGEVREKLDVIEAAFAESFVKGTCLDCGTQMPNWPPPDNDENYSIAEGWGYYENAADKNGPGFFVCPNCEAED